MKTVRIIVEMEGPGAGQIQVETEGFQGKGCEAIHNALSSGGDRQSFKKKPEWNQVQTNLQRK